MSSGESVWRDRYHEPCTRKRLGALVKATRLTDPKRFPIIGGTVHVEQGHLTEANFAWKVARSDYDARIVWLRFGPTPMMVTGHPTACSIIEMYSFVLSGRSE